MKAFIVFSLMFSLFTLLAKGQARPGGARWIRGSVWDSSRITILPAATVAVYDSKSQKLISYSITDNFGEFLLEGLPDSLDLTLKVSHVGFLQKELEFFKKSDLSGIAAGKIWLLQAKDDVLEEVVIKSPVLVKGDTLEFNADLIELSDDAQVGELLKKLPGITIWSDGEITVNGKRVDRLLVNGKVFFTDDFKMITQNLPKQIVDKVQVYKSAGSEHAADSLVDMNVQLKKGKETGLFGKAGFGYGLDRKIDGEVIANTFTPSLQLSAGAAYNNLNKRLSSLAQLLANTSYKAGVLDLDYLPDQLIPGLGEDFVAALQIKKVDSLRTINSNSLQAQGDIFMRSSSRENLIEEFSNIDLVSSSLSEKKLRNESSRDRSVNYGGNITKSSLNGDFTSFFNYTVHESDFRSNTSADMADVDKVLLSSRYDQNHREFNIKNLTISSRYLLKSKSGLFANASFKHTLNLNDESYNETIESVFRSATNSLDNFSLNRESIKTRKIHSNKLDIVVPEFFSSFVKLPFYLGMKLMWEIKARSFDDDVFDRLQNGELAPNSYLTNLRNDIYNDVSPLMYFTKGKQVQLEERLLKRVDTDVSFGYQFQNVSNSSENIIQNLSRKVYQPYIDASVRFLKTRYRRYNRSFLFHLHTESVMPEVDKIAPLIDSADISFVIYPNLLLGAERQSSIDISYNHTSAKVSRRLNYGVNIKSGLVTDFISTNTSFDSLGRRSVMFDNIGAKKFFIVETTFKRIFKYDAVQLELFINPTIEKDYSAVVLNNKLLYYSNLNFRSAPSITISAKDRHHFQINYAVGRSFYTQQESDVSFQNKFDKLHAIISSSLRRNLDMRLDYVFQRSAISASIGETSSIINAYIHYKPLRNKTIQINFSLLDIFNNNKGLQNTGRYNVTTQKKNQVLNRVIMLGVAWYPRKFGIK